MIVAVEDEAEVQSLATEADVEITWLHHNGSTSASQLLDAVRDLTSPTGSIYVWGGDEHSVMTSLGHHLRRERGLKTANISVIGYWREEA